MDSETVSRMYDSFYVAQTILLLAIINLLASSLLKIDLGVCIREKERSYCPRFELRSQRHVR
jgi:hypothetical protein